MDFGLCVVPPDHRMCHVVPTGTRLYEAEHSQTPEEAMSAADEQYPLPVPGPQCGQVWVFFSSDGISVKGSNQVVSVWKGTAWFNRGMIHKWPPAECVLVAGPGAPWAPVQT